MACFGRFCLSPVTFSRTFILVSNNSAVETTAGFPSSTNLRMVRQMGKSSSCSGPLQSIFGCNWSLFLRSIPWTAWRQTNVWLMSRNCPCHCYCPCPFQRRGCDNSRNLTEFKHNTWELVVNGTSFQSFCCFKNTPECHMIFPTNSKSQTLILRNLYHWCTAALCKKEWPLHRFNWPALSRQLREVSSLSYPCIAITFLILD